MQKTYYENLNNNTNDNTLRRIRRTKFSKSCSRCKQRKIKCDRIKPLCGACVSSGKMNFCTYDINPWEMQLTMNESRNDSNELQKEIANLKRQLRIKEDALNREENRIVTSQVDSGFENRDLAKLPEDLDGMKERANIDKLHIIAIKNLRVLYFGPTSYMSLMIVDTYCRRLLLTYIENQEQQFCKINENSNNLVVLAPSENVSQSEDFTRIPDPMPIKIPNLPSYEALSFLMDRFFAVCYSLVPFLDEQDFKNDIHQLIKDGIPLENKLNGMKYGSLACMLLVLRFAALTLTENDILEHGLENIADLTFSYVEYSKILISSSRGSTRLNLSIIQSVIMLRIYKTICPEDYNDAVETRLLLGNAIEMSRIRGLQFSFGDKFDNYLSEQERYAQKKIWLQILYEDGSQAFNFGMNPLLQEFDLDVYLDGLSKCARLHEGRESNVISHYTIKVIATDLIRKVTLTTNLKQKHVHMSTLATFSDQYFDLLNFRILSFERLLRFENSIRGHPPHYRIPDFLLRVDLVYKSFVLDFLLFLITQGRSFRAQNLKCFARAFESVLILIRLVSSFLDNPSSFFGPIYSNLIGNSILAPVMRLIPIAFTIIFRFIEKEFTISDVVSRFNHTDSSGITSWVKIDMNDEELSIKNILIEVQALRKKCSMYHSTFYLTHRIEFEFRFCFEHLRNFYYRDYLKDLFDSGNAAEADIFSAFDGNTWWDSGSVPDFGYDFNIFMSYMKELGVIENN